MRAQEVEGARGGIDDGGRLRHASGRRASTGGGGVERRMWMLLLVD